MREQIFDGHLNLSNFGGRSQYYWSLSKKRRSGGKVSYLLWLCVKRYSPLVVLRSHISGMM